MANITDEPQEYGDPQPAPVKRGGKHTWILVVFVTLVVIALPTMVILFIGMLPSMVALIIDRTKGKSATFCVTGINFIGVFPYIMDLWSGENSFDHALGMLDIFTMLIMYSAAGMGWIMFMTAPAIISSFVIVMQQKRIATLRGQQKELIEEWGPEVAALAEGFDELGGLIPHSMPGGEEPKDEPPMPMPPS